jgi:ribosomal protein L37AE/L43A
MAQSRYCPNCGSKNDYIEGVAPLNCKSCKKPLSAAAFKPAQDKIVKKAPIVRAREESSEDDEYIESCYETPFLSRLEVNVSVPKRLTVAELRNGAEIAALDSNITPSNL